MDELKARFAGKQVIGDSEKALDAAKVPSEKNEGSCEKDKEIERLSAEVTAQVREA